jgi:hypothetical protein
MGGISMSNVMNKLGITNDKWLRHRDTFSSIDWTENPQCTKDEWDIAQSQLKAEYGALQYQRDRQYPSIGDQLDMQFWDSKNGTTTWQDAVAKVKSDTPKG